MTEIRAKKFSPEQLERIDRESAAAIARTAPVYAGTRMVFLALIMTGITSTPESLARLLDLDEVDGWISDLRERRLLLP